MEDAERRVTSETGAGLNSFVARATRFAMAVTFGMAGFVEFMQSAPGRPVGIIAGIGSLGLAKIVAEPGSPSQSS